MKLIRTIDDLIEWTERKLEYYRSRKLENKDDFDYVERLKIKISLLEELQMFTNKE